jgi:hypothetical protein
MDALIQLHVAEYQALTNRCTYRIYIQFSVWGLLLLYLPLISLAWGHVTIVWLTGLVVLGATAIWQENLIEIYRWVAYIERRLRPLVAEIVPDHAFWQYERFLSAGRSKRATWWEYLFPCLSLVVIVILALFRFSQTPANTGWWSTHWLDLIGVCVNFSIFLLLSYWAKSAVKLRNEFFAGQPTQ